MKVEFAKLLISILTFEVIEQLNYLCTNNFMGELCDGPAGGNPQEKIKK